MFEAIPVELLIVRHGQSEWNAQGRWQGQADPGLSMDGKLQAVRAATALIGGKIDRVVTSDLKRARQTAEIIADRLRIDVPHLDSGLREIDVGEWTGLTRPQIDARWPDLLAAWAENRLEATPGGETLTALRTRITQTIHGVVSSQRLASDANPQTILIISHRRTISALEEASGVRPVRAGHLAGRRFRSAGPGELTPGEPINLLDAATAPSCSR